MSDRAIRWIAVSVSLVAWAMIIWAVASAVNGCGVHAA